MGKKITYRVRNWKDYNRSLINRGNLTIWFSEDAIKNWYQKPSKIRKRGRPLTYSNRTIELALTLRILFHFSLRATQGFLEGFIMLLGLKLEVFHYSQLSRRAVNLNIRLHQLKKVGKTPTDLVIDSTGLKILEKANGKSVLTASRKEEPGVNITFLLIQRLTRSRL